MHNQGSAPACLRPKSVENGLGTSVWGLPGRDPGQLGRVFPKMNFFGHRPQIKHDEGMVNKDMKCPVIQMQKLSKGLSLNTISVYLSSWSRGHWPAIEVFNSRDGTFQPVACVSGHCCPTVLRFAAFVHGVSFVVVYRLHFTFLFLEQHCNIRIWAAGNV